MTSHNRIAIADYSVYVYGRMQTKVVKLDAAKPDVAKIEEAAAVVDAGGLVAFPTETVYGIACQARPDSLVRLGELKGRGPNKHYTLHIAQKGDVKEYVPSINLRAQKLIDNAWPGPLTMVFEMTPPDIERLGSRFEKQILQCLYKDNSIGIRCPDNAVASILLGRTHEPVVAPSANITGQPPAVDAEGVLSQFGDEIELLLDAGRCKYQKNSTVATIRKNEGLQILRDGVYSKWELEKMSEVKLLFVCTGNTCRSPMAEGMFRKYLSEKLACEVDRLEQMGYKTFSAGTIGMTGLPASAEAVAACEAREVDIKGHNSSALSEEVVKRCDFIFVMCRGHRERVIALDSKAANKCMLLAENRDIADPIGQPQRVYNDCADLIEEAVRKRISELVI